MKKAIYLPTGAKTVVHSCASGYCEILLDGEYKTVAQSDLAFEDETVMISTLAAHVCFERFDYFGLYLRS